jgi:DNA-binding GntR family transcriptional regulator
VADPTHVPGGPCIQPDQNVSLSSVASYPDVVQVLDRIERTSNGLVVAEANRWTKVAPVDISAADRSYPMVWTLEALAVTLAGPRDPGRVAEMRAANERLAAAVASRDSTAASAADTEFHRLLVQAAANPELVAVIDQLKVQLCRIEITYFAGGQVGKQSVQEHDRVIRAIESADVEATKIEIERNWRESLARLRDRQASRLRPAQPVGTIR